MFVIVYEMFRISARWFNVQTAAAALAVLLAYNFHLEAPYLWGDEADTGAFAKSVLQSGRPSALVGENVLAYGNCGQLSTTLLSKRLPWVQYYVGTASISLFGDGTAGLRRLFALVGALSFAPLYLLLRRRTRAAPWVAAALLLQPQVLLFARQARYYPIVLFTVCALLWLTFEGPRVKALRLGAMLVVSVVLFHSHPLAALSFCGALALYSCVLTPDRRGEILISSAAGLASWLVWYFWLSPASTESLGPIELTLRDPAAGIGLIVLGLKAGILDLDYVGVLPLLTWPAIVGAMFLRGSGRLLLKEAVGLGGLIVLMLVVATACNALAVGVEGTAAWALLRYEPHVALLAALPLYLLLSATLQRAGVSFAVWILVLTLNAGALTHWTHPLPRAEQPLSWWPAVYKEVLVPAQDDVAAVEEALRAETVTGQSILVLPRPWTDVWTYFDGDRVRTVPEVIPDSRCAVLIEQAIGTDRLSRLMNPELALIYGTPPPSLLPYVRRSIAVAYPTFDSTRPELTRHRFARSAEVVLVRIPK